MKPSESNSSTNSALKGNNGGIICYKFKSELNQFSNRKFGIAENLINHLFFVRPISLQIVKV